MGSGWGGKRDGAGRPRKIEKYGSEIEQAEQVAAARLAQNIHNLARLADGGYAQYEDTYEPAGTILVDDIEIKETENGPRSVRVKRVAFPDKPADEMVLIKRVKRIADSDRAANVWLTEFIAGKPVAQVDAMLDVPDDSPLLAAFGAAADKIYGDGQAVDGAP